MTTTSGDAVLEAIAEDQLLEWAARIAADVPRAASFHNALLSHGKGYTDVYAFYSLKNRKDSNVLFFKRKINQETVAVYSPMDQEPLLVEALSATSLVDWNSPLCFFFVPDSLLGPIQDIAEKKSGTKLQTSSSDFYVYDPTTADTDDLVCPANYTVKQLGKKGVEQMLAAWRYSQCSDASTYYSLCQKAPSAGIYFTEGTKKQVLSLKSDGAPRASDGEAAVAWASSTMFGPLGLMDVDKTVPEAMKSELERVVTGSCAELMRREGFLVHCYLDDDDEPSIRAMAGWSKISWLTHWLFKLPQ